MSYPLILDILTRLQDRILQLVVQLGLVVVLVALLSGFLYQGWKTKRNAPFLTAAIILGLVGQSLSLTGFTGLLIGVSLVCWSFVLIYLHFESLASIRPQYWFFGIVVGLASIVTALGVLGLMPMVTIADNSYLVQRFVSSIACILAIGRSIQIVIEIQQQSPSKETNNELLGVSSLLLYRIIFFLRDSITIVAIAVQIDWMITVNTVFTYIGLIFALLGLGILILNYTIYPDFIYRLPFPVHSIMLYNQSGMTIYHRRVQAKNLKAYHEELMSGAFTAISQLVNDTLGSGAHLRHIDADEYQIFLLEVGNEDGTLAVIVSGGSLSFRQALVRFLDTLPTRIIQNMNEVNYEYKTNTQIIDEYIMASFPYLEIPEHVEINSE